MPRESDPESKKKLQILKAIAEKFRYNLNIPEYDPVNPNFNIENMIEQIKRAVVVIVDLSFERPSCYYELGVAESLHKKIIVFAKLGTNIHQTSYRNEITFYKNLNEFEFQINCIFGRDLAEKSTIY
jgi:nucleoside 2-deoxyribosyltransferase